MHSAVVNRISADAQGKTFLTCADDKTAKLWEAATGRLLQTFRPPAEQGNEGKLSACALSPDGKIAAVGGWTKAGQNTHNIFLFNTQTAHLTQRLSGMENVILDLKFHQDGTLAAALGSGGIRVFQATQGHYRQVMADRDYAQASYNLAFAPDGRLASVSYDGYLRLYNRQFKQIKQVKTRGGSKPFSVAFSPEGRKLAVGFNDSPQIDVYETEQLSLLYQPDVTGIDQNNAHYAVIFGPEGTLYAGGSYSKFVDGNWWQMILRWPNEGQGAYQEFKGGDNTIMDLKVLPEGSLLMAGGQPDIGRYRADGHAVFYQAGEVANFRNTQFNYFTVNDDGSKLSFKPLGQPAQVFDLKQRQLSASTERFETYRDTAGNLAVTDWEDSYAPRINGKATSFLDRNELARAVDIAPDGTLVVGASYSVYALDRQGQQLWRAPVPGTTWAVNVAGDGKTVIAAHSGGEIRWYRMRDGQLLLSLFVHPDGKRWVLSTPEGYYDASPGADRLIGWHLNNGADNAASFYPIGKFATTYYRPDVIAQVLTFHDIGQALAEANRQANRRQATADVNAMRPPEVVILSPENGRQIAANEVTLRYRITNPSGEAITRIKALIDGRPVETRGLAPKHAAGDSSLTLTVPSQDVAVSLIAENRFAASEPATVQLQWQGQQDFVIKPKLYVLSIGASDYQDDNLDLKYPVKDARDFANALVKQQNGLYREVVTKVLPNANVDEVFEGLEWLERQVTSKDIAMLFLAGHGVNDDDGEYYFLPTNVDPKRLRRTAVPYYEIKRTLSSLAGKAIAFIDTCHAGNVMGKRRGATDINQVVNDLVAAENGVIVFTASTGAQYSLEDDRWKNGAFTKALVEGLSKKNLFANKGRITLNMLDLYISERVKELTDGRQTPTTTKPQTIQDFPIAIIP
ncbi:MAG: caspase family protein [Hahellaceae bacterium]|nr:caspase family protein [Hahellaceae bacterium]